MNALVILDKLSRIPQPHEVLHIVTVEEVCSTMQIAPDDLAGLATILPVMVAGFQITVDAGRFVFRRLEHRDPGKEGKHEKRS